MLNFTLCLIKQANYILLLNREKPSWMGSWNGVGGKIEPNENPRESVLREIKEETGITLDTVQFKGIVTWFTGDEFHGGMYTYFAELPGDYHYSTPVKTDEGILDWKDINWILHPENRGIASNIPRSIEKLVYGAGCFEHRCFYENDQLVQSEFYDIKADIEHITDEEELERIFLAGIPMNSISMIEDV